MIDQQVTVFVIDDDPSVRRSLARLLRSAGFAVETFASAAAFLDYEAFQGMGCIVLDVSMPGLNGLELQARLVERDSTMPIIFLTGRGNIPMSVQAMKRGAIDFLTKPVDEDTLLVAVEDALVRHRDQCRARFVADAVRTRLAALTEREREVLRFLLSGALNKQIAAQLGIAEKTIKVHRARIMEKMEVRSIAELVRQCALVGIMPQSVR